MADGERSTTVAGVPLDERRLARDNWARYLYLRDRGHVRYCRRARRLEGMYLGSGGFVDLADDGVSQWDLDDAQALEDEGRKAIEFNEIADAINTALGNQIQNRVDIAFRPRGRGANKDTATTLTKVAMQVADNNDYRYRETQVTHDGFIQERGYFDLRVDYDDSLTGEIRIETLDPMDVLPDADAKSYDPDEWREVIVTRWLSLEDIEATYGAPKRQQVEQALAGTFGGDPDFGNDEGDGVRRAKFGDENTVPDAELTLEDRYLATTMVRVIDRQYWKVAPTQVVLFRSGDLRVIENATEAQKQQALAAGGMLFTRPMKRVRWTISTWGEVLLADGWSPYKHFTVVPYYPFFRRGQTRGLLNNLVGPQEMLNKALSQYLHIINTTANSGWLVEQNSLTNMSSADLEERGAETGLIIEYKVGSKKPEKITPNTIPSGVDKLVALGSQKIRTISGISDALRGQAPAGASGRAIQSLQFGSQLSLAVPLDNLAYTRHLVGSRLLDLIQGFMDLPQLLRIVERDDEGEEYTSELPINWPTTAGGVLNDLTTGEYDVVITEQPSQVTFENGQYEQAMAMKEKGAPIPWSWIIKYSSLADKGALAKIVQAQEGQSNPNDEAKAALALAMATAKNVEALFSAIRTAQALRADPALAGIADGLAKSAGFKDADAAPIYPANVPLGAPPPTSTHPLTPDNPQAGLDAGLGTAPPTATTA